MAYQSLICRNWILPMMSPRLAKYVLDCPRLGGGGAANGTSSPRAGRTATIANAMLNGRRVMCSSREQFIDPMPARGLVAAMLASRDFKGIRRKRLPIFMLGADHAFQASFERQTPHSPPASSGHELARI